MTQWVKLGSCQNRNTVALSPHCQRRNSASAYLGWNMALQQRIMISSFKAKSRLRYRTQVNLDIGKVVSRSCAIVSMQYLSLVILLPHIRVLDEAHHLSFMVDGEKHGSCKIWWIFHVGYHQRVCTSMDPVILNDTVILYVVWIIVDTELDDEKNRLSAECYLFIDKKPSSALSQSCTNVSKQLESYRRLFLIWCWRLSDTTLML